jgi:glycosyltransferase involved in cell wall biosynthesis
MLEMQNKVQQAVRRADHIIAVSGFTREALVRIFGFPSGHIHVVHHGIDPSFRPVRDPESVRRLLRRYDVRGPYFVQIGQLDPFKNFLRTLDAFSILRRRDPGLRHQLVFITPSAESHWFHSLIRRKIEALSLDKEVLILRNVPDDEIPLFYSGGSALLIPSLYEGFGMPALEAMACGTPVLASRVSSLPEVLDDAAVWVDPGSAESIADGMERLLGDDELRAELVERGLKRAARFSWQKAALETIEVYRKAARS